MLLGREEWKWQVEVGGWGMWGVKALVEEKLKVGDAEEGLGSLRKDLRIGGHDAGDVGDACVGAWWYVR